MSHIANSSCLDPESIPPAPQHVHLGLYQGDNLYFQSKYIEAHKAYYTVFEKIVSSSEDKSSELAIVYHKLGLSSLKLAKFSDAHGFLTKALEIFKSRQEDKNSLDQARVLYAIGFTYTYEAKYTQAEEHLISAVQIIRENYGEEHKELTEAYNKLSHLYKSQEKALDALNHLEKAVKISLLHESNAELATSYFYFAKVYVDLNEYDKVSDYIQKSLQIAKQVYGEHHVEIALRYIVLGKIEKKENKLHQALEYFEKSRKMLIDFLGDNHLELADCYAGIAEVKGELNQYPEFFANFKKVMEIQEQTLPKNHPKLASTYGSFGFIFEQLNKSAEALSFYSKAINIYLERNGEEDLMIAYYLDKIVEIYKKQEEYTKARKFKKKELEILLKSKNYGPNHRIVADAYNYIGFLFGQDKKSRKAIQNLLKGFKIRNSLTREEGQLEQADCFYNIAEAFESVHNVVSIESALKKSLKCYQRANEENEDETNEAKEWLEDIEMMKCEQDANNNNFF